MGSFFPRRKRGTAYADEVATARLFESRIRARDFDGISLLVSEDVTMLDTVSSPIKGRTEFIRALQKIFADYPALDAIFDEYVSSGDGLLITGRLDTGENDRVLASLWRIEFDGPLISTIQSFRAENAYSLAQVARSAGILPA